MNLPNLPTDNLYKFLALFGLTLIVVGLFSIHDRPNKLYERIYELEAQEKIVKVSNSYSAKHELDAEVKKLELKVKDYGRLIYLFIAIIFIGTSLSLFGFWQWHDKHQVYSDQIIKNEAEKHKLDHEKYKREYENSKQVRIHHLQFEKEFEVYKELWTALIDLKIATLRLRPIVENVDTSKSNNEINNEKSKAFGDALNQSWTIYQNNKPFYHRDIYILIDELIKLVRTEYYGFRNGVDQPKSYGTEEYWTQAEQNYGEIIEKIDSICDQIRLRIGLIELA